MPSTNSAGLVTLSILLLLSAPQGVVADAKVTSVTPLYSINQHPFVQIFGLPSLGNARVLEPDDSEFSYRLQIANNFTGITRGSERISLDGESRRLSFLWMKGMPGGREWGLEVSHLTHHGGFLDRSVEEFHDLFGFDQHGRTQLPRGRIEYVYSRNGVDQVRLDRAVSGLGDIRLYAALKAASGDLFGGFDAAWRVSLKLPTGNENNLLGSGSTDLAAWVSIATRRPADRWNAYGGGGILLMSTGDILPQQQKKAVGFASFGISQRFFPTITVIGQLDFHTPFYEQTDLKQIGRSAAVGLLGVQWEFEPRKVIEFSISEDIVVGASPDVVITLSLSLRY